MKSDVPLDYAVFQLSPKHSRCELVVSSNGNKETLASGLVKPFVTHLKVAEEQVSQAVNSIKLEVERHRNADTWFTIGTLERFVRFVSTPEVLEMVNTFDAEMSQLEAARNIYSLGLGDQFSGAVGGDVAAGATGGADATKKELLRAMDVRLAAVRQDFTMAFSRALAAGFNLESVSGLQQFANHFGAQRLYEACAKFISLCQRRSDIIIPSKAVSEDQVVRSSWRSDMSTDDPSEDLSGPHQPLFLHKHLSRQAGQVQQQLYTSTTQTRHHPNQSTCQQPNFSHPPQQESIRNGEEEKEKEAGIELPPSQSRQPARRLSVQDRISLFENKQKENSGGKSVSVGISAELRRLPSDASSVPSVEKAVLRRWSGASDMSIDWGNDKRDSSNAESPLCTPSSSSVTPTKSNVFSGLSDETKGYQQENETTSTASSDQLKDTSKSKDQSELHIRGGGFSGKDREASLKDQVESRAHLAPFSERKQIGVGDSGLEEGNLKSTFGVEERSRVKEQPGPERKSIGVSVTVENVKNQTVSQTRRESFLTKVREVKFENRVDDVEASNQILSRSQFRGPQTNTRTHRGQFEDGFRVKVKEVTHKETASDQSASQSPQVLLTREVEIAWKESASSGREPEKVEDLEAPIMKVQNPFSAGAEQTRKPQGRRGESDSVPRNDSLGFQSKKAPESQESLGRLQVSPVEQGQRVRQSKGNQELNDELKMKADELEKLFAEHKLRIPVDQSGSAWKAKSNEMQVDQTAISQNKKLMAVDIPLVQLPDKRKSLERTGSAGDIPKFNTPPPMKMVDNLDYGSSLRQNFSELILLVDSRGKFFEKYMQKRDAKLREDWGTKGLEKEAQLKALQHSLEQSKAEMEAKFSGSVDRQNSASALWRAEKLRLFNLRSSMKREQPVESFQNEEDDDLSELPEHNYYEQHRAFTDVSAGNDAYRSSQNKKILPNRNLSSSTRTAASVPRSSAKNSNPSSGRRRAQSENPLAQSVPNFSDFRKENTKPSSVTTKLAYRSQGVTYARSKSTPEEIPLSKDEKSRQSQSLRKSTTNPAEFKAFPSLNSDGVVLIPPKCDKEQSEQSPYDKFSKMMEAKPFLRKGNGIGPGAGASIAILKASVASEIPKDEKEFEEESPFEVEESVGVEKEEEADELQILEATDGPNVDDAKSKLSPDSDKAGMYGSENGDSVRSLSQIDPSTAAELPASPSSTFHATGTLQDSLGESPVSWASRMHHPFSYPKETLDIDASVDSPTGSPASWNSHSLTQTEVDAARMRKKWGSAQQPFLVANSSQHQSRKDVTKGFKRLLKFGRKNRGTESLVDWISATTSEGDDDTEDGRDLVNRSSEDLRKSRMGFSQSYPSDDGLNESESFNEHGQALHSSIPAPPANFKLRDDHMSGSSIKAPRSFFFPSFRSKGSDSKPR